MARTRACRDNQLNGRQGQALSAGRLVKDGDLRCTSVTIPALMLGILLWVPACTMSPALLVDQSDGSTRVSVPADDLPVDDPQINPVRPAGMAESDARDEDGTETELQDDPAQPLPDLSENQTPADDLPIADPAFAGGEEPAGDAVQDTPVTIYDTELGLTDRWGFPLFDQTGAFIDLWIDGISLGLIPTAPDQRDDPASNAYLQRQCIAQGEPEYLCRQRYGY